MYSAMDTLDSKKYMNHNMEYDSVICNQENPVEIKAHFLFFIFIFKIDIGDQIFK